MPKEYNNILKHLKQSSSHYLCWLRVFSTSHINPEKSSTTKINKHTASVYLLFTHWSFDATKNKLDYYRAKDCLKNFCSK